MKHKTWYSLITILILILAILNLHINVKKFVQPSNNQKDINTLPKIQSAKQWLKNPGFSSQQYWYPSILGDESDVNASISNEQANFVILGDKGYFELNEIPCSSNWKNFTNPDKPVVPDNNTIDENGIVVNDRWRENEEQLGYDTSIHYKRNITMSVDMSDNLIISASLQAVVNATVTEGDIAKGIEAGADINISDQWVTGDYVRFYVLISDLNNLNSFPIGEYKTVDLGEGNVNNKIDYLNDTFIMPIPEEFLIFYLTSVLSTDNFNFTITLGIDIRSEDNLAGDDEDRWNELRIKNISLNFTYEKKINQFTRVSWDQDADKISSLSKQRVVVEEALLKFNYKIDKEWNVLTSPNSEIRILINDIPHSDTIKLWKARDEFQEAKLYGFDITYLITDDVNFSIQIYLADEFSLNESFTVSISYVNLFITYTVVPPTEIIKEPWVSTLFLIIVSILGIGLTCYTIAYQLILKYPVPVRKVRKYRKKLRKGKKPKINIISREVAFRNTYENELRKSLGFTMKGQLKKKEKMKDLSKS